MSVCIYTVFSHKKSHQSSMSPVHTDHWQLRKYQCQPASNTFLKERETHPHQQVLWSRRVRVGLAISRNQRERVKIKEADSMTKVLGFCREDPSTFTRVLSLLLSAFHRTLVTSITLLLACTRPNAPPCLTCNFCVLWLPSFAAVACYSCPYTFLFHEPSDDLDSRVVKVISGISMWSEELAFNLL